MPFQLHAYILNQAVMNVKFEQGMFTKFCNLSPRALVGRAIVGCLNVAFFKDSHRCSVASRPHRGFKNEGKCARSKTLNCNIGGTTFERRQRKNCPSSHSSTLLTGLNPFSLTNFSGTNLHLKSLFSDGLYKQSLSTICIRP